MKKKLIISAVISVIAVVVFILVYFEPQSALFNHTSAQVQKGDVVMRSSTTIPQASNNPGATSQAPTTTLPRASEWRSRAHKTTGTVSLTRDDDGKTYVRFENLDTTNGPDLRIYIAKSLDSDGTPIDSIDLGELVANQGDANYSVPQNVNVNEYAYVVIWCKRFSVSFADAKL